MISSIANHIYIIIFSITAFFGSLELFDNKYQQVTITPTGTQTVPATVGVSETPGSTLTEIATTTISPTTTLMPLPEITLIFPAVTRTSTTTVTPGVEAVLETPGSILVDDELNIPPRIRVLYVAIVVIWLLLAGFLILLVRHFR